MRPADSRRTIFGAAPLVRAGGTLAARSDDASRDRAATILERALDADPTSATATGALVALLQDRDKLRLVATLRAALEKTKQPETVLLLAIDIARAARGDADDLPLVVSALERAREAAPTHAPTWLALAKVSVAQSAWPEAIRAYEPRIQQEPPRTAGAKKRALLALGEVHRRLGDALRCSPCPGALAIAIRRTRRRTAGSWTRCVRFRSTKRRGRSSATGSNGSRRPNRRRARARRRGSNLASLRKSLGDCVGTEQLLVRAVAEAPTPKNLARLASTRGTGRRRWAPRDHVRTLEQVPRARERAESSERAPLRRARCARF